MRERNIHRQALLEAIVCGAAALLLFNLVRTGRYERYVTARMAPYLVFAAVVLTVWAIASARRLTARRHRQRSAHALVLAVPILLLLWPHSPLSASDLSGRFLDRAAVIEMPTAPPASVPAPNPAPSHAPSGASGSENPSIAMDPALRRPVFTRQGLDEEAKTIVIEDEDFASWMGELFRDPSVYEGYSVTVKGFVFKDPEFFGADGFVPARLMMTCCVADLVPAGMVARYEQTPGLPEGAWYSVTGTLTVESLEYAGVTNTVPTLQVTAIEPAEPVEGFIVP